MAGPGNPHPGAPLSAGELHAVLSALVDRWTSSVLTAFERAGVPNVLLKGPAVARWLYPDDPGQRPYSDVDLLVQEHDRPRAEAILTALGFVPTTPDGLQHGLPVHSVDWRRASDGASVDLHTSLHALTLLDPARVWAAVNNDTEAIEVDGVTATVPGPAMRALHLALHLRPMYGPTSKPWRDLERGIEVVDRATWHGAARLAGQLEVEDILSSNLRRVGPDGVALADALGLTARPSSEAWLLTSRQRVQWMAELRALPTLRQRARFAFELVVPPPRTMADFAGLEHPTRARLALAYARRVVGFPAAASAAARDYLSAERRRQAAPARASSAQDLPVLRTTGDSMLPTLQPGDVVVIDPTATRPHLGEIAVFRRPEGLVVHRVVSSRRRRQMGDNAVMAFAYLNEDVEGTVVAVVQHDGQRRDLRDRAERRRGIVRALRRNLALRVRRWARNAPDDTGNASIDTEGENY